MSTQLQEKERCNISANTPFTVRNNFVTSVNQQIDSLNEEYQLLDCYPSAFLPLHESELSTLYLDWALAYCHESLADYYSAQVVAGVVNA